MVDGGARQLTSSEYVLLSVTSAYLASQYLRVQHLWPSKNKHEVAARPPAKTSQMK